MTTIKLNSVSAAAEIAKKYEDVFLNDAYKRNIVLEVEDTDGSDLTVSVHLALMATTGEKLASLLIFDGRRSKNYHKNHVVFCDYLTQRKDDVHLTQAQYEELRALYAPTIKTCLAVPAGAVPQPQPGAKASPKGKEKEVDAEQEPAGADFYDSFKRAARSGLRGKINDFFAPEKMYAYAACRLSEVDTAGRQVLKDLMLMDPKQRVKTLNVLATSSLEYVNTPIQFTEADLVAAFKKYAGIPADPAVLSALHKPANQNSPYKNFSTVNAGLHNPVSNLIEAPDGSTAGLVVLVDACYPKVDSCMIYPRLMAERCAFISLMRNLGKYKFSNSDIEQVSKCSTFVIDDLVDFPDPVWSRATVKIVANDDSTAYHKSMKKVACYTLRSGYNRDEKDEDYNDSIYERSLATIPTCAYGSEQASLFAVLTGSDEGRQVIKKYEIALKNDYEPFDIRYYKNYYHAYTTLLCGGENAFYNFGEVEDGWEAALRTYGEKRGEIALYNKDFFEAKLMKIMATNQAIRAAIAEELSIAGIVHLPSLAILRKAFGSDCKVIAIAAHEIVGKFGFDISHTDGSIGQNLAGEFRGLKLNQQKIERLDVGHDYAKPDGTRFAKYYRKRGFLPADIGDHLLVDLTVDGAMYNPQNKQNFDAGVSFKAKRMLVGVCGQLCLYSADELMRFRGFVVYIGSGFFNPLEMKIEQKRVHIAGVLRLLKKFKLTIGPTNLIDWTGHYLIGVERGVAVDYPDFSLLQLSRIATLMTITKGKALVNGFAKYNSDPQWTYNYAAEFLPKYFPTVMADLRTVDRVPIGTKAAFSDYIHFMKGKTNLFANLLESSNINEYFSLDPKYQDMKKDQKLQDSEAELLALLVDQS